jgi:hypothetical protein
MDRPLANQRILMFVGDIYEDLEVWYPKLRLIEAGAEVVLAGPEAKVTYAGKHGYPCKSDVTYNDVKASEFAGLIVPGGFMPDKLRREAKVLQLVRDFNDAEADRRCLPWWMDTHLRRRVSRGARHRFAGYQRRPGERRCDLGRQSRSD